MSDYVEPHQTDWSIESPDCPFCGSNNTRHIILHVRDRIVVGEGDVIQDEFIDEFDILEVECGSCDELLHRSEGYAAYLNATRD